MLDYNVEQGLKGCLTLHREGKLSVTGLVASCVHWQLTVLEMGRSSQTAGTLWVKVLDWKAATAYLVDEQGLISED